MGFFDKLFGGSKKESGFTPSAELMPEDRFWGLIVASNEESEGDADQQEDSLRELLQELPLQEVITFQNRYRQLRGVAYTWPLWGAAYIINGGCSDDGFCYFRDWLIARGPEVYKQAIADAEWLVNVEWSEDGFDAEGMCYVAGAVFEKRTGDDLPAQYAENFEISGTEWEEEGDDLARMFPKLWAKYGERYQR
ncbi:MAG TPA: DUF4240 domain-containing protein [Puia sp.]|jgi:hypothetical protein|nr:DUF4240 domain-containing protein [Puia sp.]